MKNKKIGILITHGTDTMAWTLSYLKYAIKNLTYNIAITGSQLPMSDEFPFSDAYKNIRTSLFFLNRIKTPTIFSVFNNGRYAYSDSLQKVRKWKMNAYEGDMLIEYEWDDIKHITDKIKIREGKIEPNNLDNLYLVTTGGTIDSQKNDDGLLTPRSNKVHSFITEKYMEELFNSFRSISVFSIDSTDMTLEKMELMVEKLAEEINDDIGEELIKYDDKFSKNVEIIYLDPLKTNKDFEKQIDNETRGIVIAGYGGSNVPHKMNDLIKKWNNQGKIVVVSSQAPVGISDTVYENGAKPLKHGAISGVDFSLVECQMRLSYILGHWDQIKKLNNPVKKVKKIFLSSAKFRNKASRKRHKQLTSIDVVKQDLISNIFFEETLKLV